MSRACLIVIVRMKSLLRVRCLANVSHAAQTHSSAHCKITQTMDSLCLVVLLVVYDDTCSLSPRLDAEVML